MSPHAYSENQLVEQPAIGLFAALGWPTVSAMGETFGCGGTLGRETKGEVVLVDRLRAALDRLNPALPPEAIQSAIDELTRERSQRLVSPHGGRNGRSRGWPPPLRTATRGVGS